MIIMFVSSLSPSRAPVHAYMYPVIRNYYFMHHFFQTYLNIIIIIDVKKHNNLLLNSMTLTAKCSKKNVRRQVNEKFYKFYYSHTDWYNYNYLHTIAGPQQ